MIDVGKIDIFGNGNTIDLSGFSIILTKPILFIALIAVAVVFVIFSIIFIYHMEKYGFVRLRIKQAELIFFFVSLVLLSIMTLLVVVY